MTRDEFIKKINDNKYYSLWDIQIPDAKLVDYGLYFYSHGWYNIATDVYELEDGYVGVRGVNGCSSSHSYNDVAILCKAFPMKKVETYVKE